MLTSRLTPPKVPSLLEEVAATEASHMFGFNGEHTLARRMRFVLVAASSVYQGGVNEFGWGKGEGPAMGPPLASPSVRAALTRPMPSSSPEC